jgi:hypothetical protein
MASVRRLRSDLGVFAAEVGCPLTDWQLRSLSLEARATVIVGARQMGKSRALAVLATWWAFRKREQLVLIISAGDLAAKRLLAEVRSIVTGSELLADSAIDEAAGLLTLRNGSQVRSVPASTRQVRGWRVDLLLVDEAGSPSADVILSAALPTTTARPESRMVLADSAWGAEGPFYDFARQGELGSEFVRTHRWVAKTAGGDADAPWVSPSIVEMAREGLGELRFRAEYLGEFASGADALFTRKAIEQVTADYRPLELGELRGPARVAAGQDWGATTDRSAHVALASVPIEGERVFAVVCAKRWPAGFPLHQVVEDVCRSSAAYGYLAAETNGLGAALAGADPTTGAYHGMLWRAMAARPQEIGGGRPPARIVLIEERPWLDNFGEARVRRERRPGFCTTKVAVHRSAEEKAATFSQLRLLVDRGRLLIPADAEELRRELLMLRVDLSPSGSERIEARSGHDDLADALSLSLIPYRGQGTWRTLIGELADRRLPEPDRGLPPDLATVRAGNGLEVPVGPGRECVFQSVSRSRAELTLPVGVEPAAETEKDDGTTQISDGVWMRRA